MKLILRAATAVFAVLVAVSAVHANPLITTVDRQSAECLDRMHKRMRKLALIQLDEHARCHRARMQGSVVAGTDCNDPASVTDPSRIDYWVDKIKEPSRVCGPSYTPAEQGFTSCPAPCSAISVVDYNGVASCMACLTEGQLGVVAEEVFGTPSLPKTRDQMACQQRVLQGFLRYFLARIEAQKSCRLLQKYLKVDASVDCRAADLNGRAAKGLERLGAIVGKCNDAEIGSLDGCAASVAGEQSCLEATAILHSDTLYDFIHP